MRAIERREMDSRECSEGSMGDSRCGALVAFRCAAERIDDPGCPCFDRSHLIGR